MAIPNDPIMLLSYINTQLRDFYSSLDAFCEDNDVDKNQIVEKLKMVGYDYSEEMNKFV